MTSPIDLMGIFCTPSMGVGQRLRLATIDKRLARLPVRLVIELLGQASCHADQSIARRDQRRELAERFFPEQFLPRMRQLLDANPNLLPVSSQVVANLAARALTVCPDRDYDAGDIEPTVRELGALTLGLADHVMAGAHDEKDLTLAVARMAIYFRLNDLSSWYEVARRLLFETLPGLVSHPDYLDGDAVCRKAYGIDLELLWALTVAFGVLAKTNTDFYLLPSPILGGTIDEATTAKWVKIWSIDVEGARRLATADVQSGSWWSFSSFFDRPVIMVTPDKGVAVRPAFLAQKATPAGMFWTIRNGWVEAGGSHEQWARLFGAAVEALGRQFVNELLPSTDRLFNDDAVRRRWGDGKLCDMVLLGRNWVAIDFVHRQLTRATATTGNYDDLAKDLQLAAVEKLEQIDEALARGVAVEESPESIIPLVVVGAPFPSSPLVLRQVEAMLGIRLVIGTHPVCRPPLVMDLSEFHVLLQVAHALGQEVTGILDQWLSSDLGRDSFRSWLTTDGPGRTIPGGGAISAAWMEVIRKRLFGLTDGAPPPAAAHDTLIAELDSDNRVPPAPD